MSTAAIITNVSRHAQAARADAIAPTPSSTVLRTLQAITPAALDAQYDLLDACAGRSHRRQPRRLEHSP
jgi:hypothetical protein